MKKGILVVFIIALIGVAVYLGAYYSSTEDIQITVTDKERIVDGSGENLSSKYLVFTETETFENTDALIFGKWNSSDIQGKLKVEDKYKVRVAGWRVPFLSMYRNIIKVY